MEISKWLSAGVVICATMAMSGCGTAVTWYASWKVNDKHNDTSAFKPESDRYLIESAQRFGLMAMLAEAVYRRDLPEEKRDDEGCAYLSARDPKGESPIYGLPQAGKENRWVRWVPERKEGVDPCWDDKSGLHYETYVHEGAGGQIDEAVVAFRGTENRPGQTYRDWRSNLAAFFGFEPAQYAAARVRMVKLMEELDKTLGGRGNIFVTGHSLGGGLAQQAGYMSRRVKEVYTFNTSPVSNWTHLRLNKEVENQYPIIHRVYHGGEFLEKLRFIAASATSARYGRHDLGLQLESRSNFAGHSIQMLACTFSELILLDPNAKQVTHYYPVSFIRGTLQDQSNKEQPCWKDPKGQLKQ